VPDNQSMFDVDAYLTRIGYSGPRVPTLPVLHALTAAHSQTIPFENLDVLLGRPIDLAPDAIFDKLVRRHRGGYCFEQNGLLLQALEALGFRARPLSARVRLDRPRDYTPPRTHMFLRVEIADESWLTDVGVGGLSLTGALRLAANDVQETPHGQRRIVREDGLWFHQARIDAGWIDVYEFTGEEMPLIDRRVANWFTSTHPESHFRNRLMVARAAPEGRRITLLNRELKLRDRHGVAETHAIDSPDALRHALAQHFGLDFPDGTRFGDGPAPWPT
jgi:N-hydroxyarylamine O-acetyltransferase